MKNQDFNITARLTAEKWRAIDPQAWDKATQDPVAAEFARLLSESVTPSQNE